MRLSRKYIRYPLALCTAPEVLFPWRAVLDAVFLVAHAHISRNPDRHLTVCRHIFLVAGDRVNQSPLLSHPSSDKKTQSRCTRRIIIVIMAQPSMDSKRDYADDAASSVHSPRDEEDQYREHVRPPIDYSSFGALMGSVWARWKSLWTRRFIFSFIAGQVVSFCITVTNVTTTELVSRNWSLPTTQTWFL